MKRLIALLFLIATIAMLCAAPSWAVFPKADGTDVFALYQGYLNNDLVWFTAFETNDIRLATSALFADFIDTNDLFEKDAYHYPQFAPKLTSALEVDPCRGLAAARPLYVVINHQQGPVFTTRPGNDDYSGL